jgi:hypothetical protein
VDLIELVPWGLGAIFALVIVWVTVWVVRQRSRRWETVIEGPPVKGRCTFAGDTLPEQVAAHLRECLDEPVSLVMVPACVASIQLAREGNWTTLVDLPDGVTWDGHPDAPVSDMVREYSLMGWVAEGLQRTEGEAL